MNRRLRPLLVLAAFAFVPVAVAQDLVPIGYSEALELAVEASADVATARLDLAEADRELARTEADPLALRVPVLQATQALELRRSELLLAELRARDASASAYTDVLAAVGDRVNAETALALAGNRLEAARIRFEAGAVTRLDLERAENDLASAERDLRDAEQVEALARDRLASLLDRPDTPFDPEAALPPAELAPLDATLDRLDENVRVLQATQAVELAEAQLAAVDNPYSARADVEAARTRLDNARLQADETRRTLNLAARQAYNAAVSAAGRLDAAEANLRTAREDAAAQQVRFESGSVSRLQRDEARLAAARAEAARDAARYALLAALRQLELSVLGAS